jgi:hypothetical protein
MSDLSAQVRNAGGILQALDAVRNVRALMALATAFAAAAALIGLLGGAALRGSFGIGALGALLGLLAAFIGYNAAGIVLMDETRSYAARSFADVWMAAVFATLKFIVVLLGIVLGLLLLFGAVALVFWICKLPYLGPLLFAFALPLAIVVLGLALFGVAASLFPIALPALWAGDGIATALARVAGVVRTRLASMLVLLVLLSLLVGFVAAVMFSVLFWGWASSAAIADAVLGGFGDFWLAVVSGAGASGPGGPTRLAGVIGGGVATALALVLPILVQIKGFSLIYFAVAHDLDAQAIEARLREGMAQVKQKADAARERVQQHNAGAEKKEGHAG